MKNITSFLFSDYRRRVLSLLLLHPDTSYHVRELARLTDTSAGSLHRELSKLANAQVLIRKVSGNQVYYQANSAFFIFEELANILRKTSGLVDVLANALTPLSDKIEVALIFGSVGSGKENSESDIDLLVIGNVSFADVVTATYPTQEIVKREINPKIYTRTEWQKLLKSNTTFIKEIITKPKLFIIGNNDDLK